MFTVPEIQALNQRFHNGSTQDLLRWAWERFETAASIGTSFQGAGLVMIHCALQMGFKFPVFTLDTGLLFKETIELQKRLEDFFGISIERLEPDLTLDEQADVHGPELWRRTPDLCCTVRKVLPLKDKLGQVACWITGLRRDQSQKRATTDLVELYVYDELSGRDIVKLNPMATWSREQVWEYIHRHQIPYNPLHDRGYRSIGCWPCTRETQGGEEERAGRWTGFAKVECGIHTFLPKKVDFQI